MAETRTAKAINYSDHLLMFFHKGLMNQNHNNAGFINSFRFTDNTPPPHIILLYEHGESQHD